MDAYVFATSATQGAISTLIGGVGSGGPARVVLPLSGDRALYVAVTAADSTGLSTKISQVVATQILGGTTAYVATSTPSTSPTYASPVDDLLGFSLLTGANLSNIASAAAQISGVVGVAVTNGTNNGVLVESTADGSGDLATIMANVAGISGASVSFEATGVVANGAGF